MSSTLRVTEPREILSLVPFRLGFRPRDSVVALSLRAPHGRIGLAARLDLPDLADPLTGPGVARALVSTLATDGAESSLLVVYVDQDPRASPGAEALAVAHYREAADVPLGPTQVWVVTSTGYLGYDCRHGCCPPGGRPLRDLESTRVSAHMVLEGQVVVDSREDLVRFPTVDGERRRTVARVRRRWEQRGDLAQEQGDAALVRWRLDSVAAWRDVTARCAAPGEEGPGVVARVIRGADRRGAAWGRVEAGLADPRVRDAVLVSLIPGTGDLPERCVATARLAPAVDAELGRALARVVGPRHGGPPPESAWLHERALELVVAHGRRAAQAPALTLLAWLAWWRGDGTRARILVERALLDDEEYRLARLLGAALDAAAPPGWARHDARPARGEGLDEGDDPW